MGTKVQYKTYSRGYYSVVDLKDEPNNRGWPGYYGDKVFHNCMYYDGCWPSAHASEYVEREKDIVKQTILEHEAIFRNQVLELHRLYKIQKDMMDEIRRKGAEKQKPTEPFFLRKHASTESSYSLQRKMIDLQLPADEYIEIDGPRKDPDQSVNKLCDLNEPAKCDECGNTAREELVHLQEASKSTMKTLSTSEESGFVKLEIDLNSLAEEEEPFDEDKPPIEDRDVKRAAEAMVSISSLHDDSRLHWFVGIVLSGVDGPEPIAEMDFFESMTLGLEESNVEEFLKPRDAEEIGRGGRASLSRKGRHRRDFQRDILPGLASLSRHEVSEDLRRFGGVARRNGLRKRCTKGLRISLLEPGFDDGGLTGWGKTVRRLRRPRCHPGRSIPIRLT